MKTKLAVGSGRLSFFFRFFFFFYDQLTLCNKGTRSTRFFKESGGSLSYPSLRKVHFLACGLLISEENAKDQVSVLLKVTSMVRAWGEGSRPLTSHNSATFWKLEQRECLGLRACAFLANFRVSMVYKKEAPLSS